MMNDTQTLAPPVAANSSAKQKTFIRATEVWTPDADGERLTLSVGIYGELADFAAASRDEFFTFGEGLPGKAWAEGRPVVLNGFRGSYFKRTEAAEAAGLTAGVAVPVFDGFALKGVVVFLCGDDIDHIGAIEVWRAQDEPGAVMTLDDGYYGTAAHFEWISKHTEFPKGMGLPGSVWKGGVPVLMRDLGASHRFIRAESAGGAGLTTGVGLPIHTPAASEGAIYVLALLSALGTPIARRFEVWACREDGSFELEDQAAEKDEVYTDRPSRRVAPGQGLIGRLAVDGVPLAAASSGAVAGDSATDGAIEGGYSSVVALPVYRSGSVDRIVAWYF